MIRRADLPDALPAHTREALDWFLGNFQVHFLSSVHWDNLNPWFKERRKITDNFLLFPAHPIYAATDTESRTILPGEFFAIPEGVWHCYGLQEDMPRSASVMVHLHFDTKLHANPLGIFSSVFHRLRNYDRDYQSLQQLSSLELYSPDAARLFGNAWFTNLLAEMIIDEADSLTIPQTYHDKRITQAIRYISKHLDCSIGVQDMAAQAGIGLVRFRQLFKRQTGFSPQEYLIDARIKRAGDLLLSSELRMIEIAQKTGFANEFYFCNAFRRATGLSPSQFRLQDGHP